MTVRFELVPAEMPSDLGRPFLAGTFNAWNPSDSSYAMHNAPDGSWYLDVPASRGDTLEYKYTLGTSWTTVEVGDEGEDRPNRVAVAAGDLVQRDTTAGWLLLSRFGGVWPYADVDWAQARIINTYVWSAQTSGANSGESRLIAPKVDDAFEEVRRAWIERSPPHFASYTNLSSSVYGPVLIYWSSLNGVRLSVEQTCYVARTYMLGRLEHDLEQASVRWWANSRLLGDAWETLVWLLPCEDLTVDEIQHVVAFAPRLSDAIEAYESVPDVPNLTTSNLATIRRAIQKVEPLLNAKLAAVEGRFDAAEQHYASAVRNSDPNDSRTSPTMRNARSMLWVNGPALARKTAAAGDTERAFRMLELMAANARATEMPRDRLAEFFREIDPAAGEARLARALDEGSRYGTRQHDVNLERPYATAVGGDSLALSSLLGEFVLIDFWHSRCGPCVAEIPELNKLATESRNWPDFAFVSVASDPVLEGDPLDPSEVRAFVQGHSIAYPVLLDDPSASLTEQFAVSAWPTKILLDPSGGFVGTWAGAHWSELAPLIDELVTAGSGASQR